MDDRQKLQISKMEAAKRQLDCAIELWFRDRDEVSVHTLAAAAYQIIHDINHKRKTGETLLYDSRLIRDEYRKLWLAAVKEPVNFFKHADSDPDGTIEFSPFGNLTFMMFCTHGLSILKEDVSDHVHALGTWILLHKPDLIFAGYRNLFYEHIPVEDIDTLRKMEKGEFFECYLLARKNARIRGILK